MAEDHEMKTCSGGQFHYSQEEVTIQNDYYYDCIIHDWSLCIILSRSTE